MVLCARAACGLKMVKSTSGVERVGLEWRRREMMLPSWRMGMVAVSKVPQTGRR